MKSDASLLALSLTILLSASGCAKRLDPSFEGTIAVRTTLSSGKTVDQAMEFKNGKFRVQRTSSGASPDSLQFYTLVDTRLRELVAVTDKDKRYTKADYATVFGMHPDEKAPKRTAVDKKSSSTVAGFTCSNWEVQSNGQRQEICATPFVDLAVLRAGPGDSTGATGLPDPTMFPLRTVTFGSEGEEIMREEVVRIERGSVDDARLAIPVGYTEVKEQPL